MIGWKVSAVVLLLTTIGASSLAFYYHGQVQGGQQPYYAQWQSDEAKISSLNQQVQSDQQTIQYWKNQAANGYSPSCAPSCDSMIASLNGQISSDNQQIATYQAQIASYQDILGLKKSFTAASSVTTNEPACGGSGNSICQGSSACTNFSDCIPQNIFPNDFIGSFCSANNPANCQGVQQGVLVVSWTSTVPMTVTFSSSFQGSASVSTTSTSSASGDFAFPIFGTFFSSGFHNDSCHSVGFGNYACDAVSLTYSETFYY